MEENKIVLDDYYLDLTNRAMWAVFGWDKKMALECMEQARNENERKDILEIISPLVDLE